jgi:hypothetical protein
MSLVLMLSLNVSSMAVTKTVKKAAVKILSTSNITKTITQNDKYTLPKTVVVKLSNGKSANIAVKWNKSTIKTNVPGTYKFNGKIKDYPKDVKLTLVIKPLPVAIEAPKVKVYIVPDPVEITQNDSYTLPKTVVAEMSDGSKTEIDIKWNVDVVKTDVPGEFTFSGKVPNNPDEIMLKLTIKPLAVEVKKPVIASIEKPAIMSAKENEIKELPSTVVAVMDDNSKVNINVTWNKKNSDLVMGLNKLEGTVEGYNGVVKLNFLVRGQDLTAPEKIENQEAKIGDIVGVKGNLGGYDYEHYGVFIGNGNVIEYSSKTGKIQDAQVTLNPMSKSFSKYYIYKLKDNKYTPEEIVARANSRVGEKKYDLIGNNCENFAVWCQTNVSKSYQIDALSLSNIELLDSLIQSTLINIQ